MTETPYHYLNPKLEARENPAKGSFGIFACQPVQAGELLAVWGGKIMDLEGLRALPAINQSHAIQVDEDLYLGICGEPEPADYANHSCNPNAGLHGQISLVAMRAIEPGEEVCFDYAMSDGTPYDEFKCGCGAPNCRGKVTGDDWRLPELWERYAGYFSPYLQRRIEQLAKEMGL